MIILMGLAGSGKSTQGKILAEELGGAWMSPGQVLRDTDNDEVHALQLAGVPVPDAITIPVMAEAVDQIKAEGKEVILDGTPRTVDQAKWMVENGIEVAIWIDVPKDELLRRLGTRQRDDDANEDAIRERFRAVEQNLCSVCRYFQSNGVKIVKVNGVGDPAEVTQRVLEVVHKIRDGEEMELFDAGTASGQCD